MATAIGPRPIHPAVLEYRERMQREASEQAIRDCEFGRDPISEERFTNAYIDQCGHTFSLSTLNDLLAATPEGRDVLCPFSRRRIDFDALIRNRFVDEAVDTVERYAGENASLRYRVYYMGEAATPGSLAAARQEIAIQREAADEEIKKQKLETAAEVRRSTAIQAASAKKISNVANAGFIDKTLIFVEQFFFSRFWLNRVINRE